MQFHVPPNDSLFWPYLRMVLLTTVIGLRMYYGYNTWDPVKDPGTMLVMALLSGGFDGLKRIIAPTEPKKE